MTDFPWNKRIMACEPHFALISLVKVSSYIVRGTHIKLSIVWAYMTVARSKRYLNTCMLNIELPSVKQTWWQIKEILECLLSLCIIRGAHIQLSIVWAYMMVARSKRYLNTYMLNIELPSVNKTDVVASIKIYRDSTCLRVDWNRCECRNKIKQIKHK